MVTKAASAAGWATLWLMRVRHDLSLPLCILLLYRSLLSLSPSIYSPSHSVPPSHSYLYLAGAVGPSFPSLIHLSIVIPRLLLLLVRCSSSLSLFHARFYPLAIFICFYQCAIFTSVSNLFWHGQWFRTPQTVNTMSVQCSSDFKYFYTFDFYFAKSHLQLLLCWVI